jgi:hypothetical protein
LTRDPAAGAEAALAISRHLATLADGMNATAAAFPTAPTGWQSAAGEILAGVLSARPEQFRAVAVACGAASAALSRHAEQLAAAVVLQRQAGQAPIELAMNLDRRVGEVVDESARQAAGTLLSLAGSAPAREDSLRHWLRQLETIRSEVVIGTAQSTEQLLDTAASVAVRLGRPYDPRTIDDLRSVSSALVDGARHPVELAKAVTDWDTWRTNPARAIGHLLPDVAAALASGGIASGARAAETLSRSRGAIAAAAARDSLRRRAAAAAGYASRQGLVERAVAAAQRPGAQTWHGEGGTRLTARQSTSAEAFHALTSAEEPSVTAALKEVSNTADAELVGLRNRLKQVESFKRKLATQYAITARPLPELLARAQDAVRYTVVIDETSYTRGVSELAAMLERRGFLNLSPPNNAWYSGRYRGINSSWLDPATGAAFELQFHTPASWRITRQTHSMYEEFRLPQTPPERKAELSARIAEAYRAAPVPAGVESLNPANFPPPSAPDPITPPVNYTVHAALAGGLGEQLLGSELASGSQQAALSCDR